MLTVIVKKGLIKNLINMMCSLVGVLYLKATLTVERPSTPEN